MTQAKATRTKATQNQKIKGKFYPLQHDEWVKACKELSPAAKDVLYYIRTVDPYSKGVELTAAAIARELEVNRSTISRAFKELDAKGYVDMEILSAKLRVTGKGLLSVNELKLYFDSDEAEEPKVEVQGVMESDVEDVAKMQQRCVPGDFAQVQESCENATPVAKMQHAVQNNNTLRKNATYRAKLQQAQSETLTPTEFPHLKTNKDFNKTNQTLSEATRERNVLLWKKLDVGTQRQVSHFAYQVAIPKLPTRPTLPDAWITCHCEELFNQMMRDVEFQKKWGELSANSPKVENPIATEEAILW